MPAIGEQELKKAISSAQFSNVYLLYGEEGYLKQHYVSQMQKKLIKPSLAEFNLHTFEGRNVTMDEILSAAQALPLMSDYSCVVVHDYPFNTWTESERKVLKEFLSDVPESTVLIFWLDGIEVDPKNQKWKTVISYFTKAGDSVQLARRDTRSLTRLLMDGAKKRGCEIEQNACTYMISVVGIDLQTLLSELEKLCSFIGVGRITKETVDLVSTKCLSAKVFDMSRALVRHDYEMAYSILNNLIALKEEPISILAVISTSYVDMYRAKCAKISGEQAMDVTKYFNYRGKEFRITNISRDCDKLSIAQLRASVDALVQADISLKSSSVDGKLILEETMVKLLIISKDGTL